MTTRISPYNSLPCILTFVSLFGKKTGKSALTLVALLALFAGAQAAIINVPADQATIQAAVNAAASGDTVVVANGTYNESVNVGSAAGDITIMAANAGLATVDGGSNRVFYAVGQTGDITIDGFVLMTNINDSDSAYVYAENLTGRLTVQNCTLSPGSSLTKGETNGIYLLTTNSNTPTNLSVLNCTFGVWGNDEVVHVDGEGANGDANILIDGNTNTGALEDETIEINLEGANGNSTVVITNNTFSGWTGSGKGVELEFGDGGVTGYTANFLIQGNTFTGPWDASGIQFDWDGSGTIFGVMDNNTITGGPRTDEGIVLDDESDNAGVTLTLFITNNTITSPTESGIYLRPFNDEAPNTYNLVIDNNTVDAPNAGANEAAIHISDDGNNAQTNYTINVEITNNTVTNYVSGGCILIEQDAGATVNYLESGNTGCTPSTTGTPNPNPVPAALGSIGNFVWDDLNQNGIQDGGGEIGIPGVTISFSGVGVSGSTSTNGSGNYTIPALPMGTYTLTLTLPNGYQSISAKDQGGNDNLDSDFDPSTLQVSVTLAAGQTNNTVDAGLSTAPPCPTITFNTAKTDIPCPGGNTGTITVTSPAGGTSPYIYSIDGTNFFPSGSFTNLAANTYTVSVRDTNGCIGTASVTISDTDNTPPTAVCQDITVYLDGNGDATITAADVDNGSTDNCALGGLSVLPGSFTCSNTGPNAVVLTVPDLSGNQDTCIATVTVNDSTPPVALCQNLTVQLDASGTATITAADVDGGSTDNCNAGSSAPPCNGLFFSEYIEGSSNNKAFEIYNPGSSAVNLTDYVVYRYNNGSLTPTDSLFPQGVLASKDVFVVANFSANAAILASADTTHSMTFYNGDDAMSLINRVTGDTLDIIGVIGVDPGTGWIVGAGATNNFTLIRKKMVTEGETDWTISVTQWDVFPINMTDSLGSHTGAPCSSGNTGSNLSFSVSANSFDCSNLGQNPVVLTATDRSGNSDSCTAVVTVEDTIPPVALCQDITVLLDASGNSTITAADVDGGSSDNCSIDSLWLSRTAFDCTDLTGSHGVQMQVFDGNGNMDNCFATVTVEDTVAPVAQCVSSLTVYLDSAGQASITTSDVDSSSTDNCGSLGFALDKNLFDCNDLGSNTVTLTVRDSSSTGLIPDILYYRFNESGTTITNEASNPPAGTATATIVGGLSQGGTGLEGGALIGVGGNSGIDYVSTGWNTDLGTGSWTLAFWTDSVPSSTTLFYQFGDGNAGNFRCFTNGVAGPGNWWLRGPVTDVPCTGCAPINTPSFVAFVYDSAAGEIRAYHNGVLNNTVAQSALNISGSAFKVGGYSSSFTGMANGQLMDEFMMFGRALPPAEIESLRSIGNASRCTATVYVRDSIAPVLSCGGGPSGSATYNINTATNPAVGGVCPGNSGIDNTYDCAFDGQPPINIGTFTDASPTGSILNSMDLVVYGACSGDVQFYLNGVPIASGTASGLSCSCQSIASDPNIPQNYSVTMTPAIQAAFVVGGVNTLSVSTSNSAAGAQCFYGADVNVSFGGGGGGIVVSTDSGQCSAVVAFAIPTASDNCPATVSQIAGLASGATFPIGTTTNTFVATDPSGNADTCSFTVTVNDSIPPNAVCQAPTVYLDGSGSATITPADMDGGSSDNCSIDSMWISRSQFGCNDLGTGSSGLVAPWINEIHYDNTGTDTGEFIEIAGPAGTDLTGYQLVLYNGSSTVLAPYNTFTFSSVLSNQSNGYGFIVVNYPTNGIQNGTPDGMALVDSFGNVIEFLSYEGSFTPTSGPAAGMPSTDIGVSEGSSTPIGHSLQRNGTGYQASDFSWSAEAANTGNAANTSQTFVAPPSGNTVVLTVTDAAGNTSTCSGTVTVVDSTAPTAVCQSVTVYLDASGNATITTGDIDNGSSDNCAVDSLALSQNSFGCSDVSAASQPADAWINEFHYDNAGGDVGEFIEVAGPAGLDLTGYSLVLYNGSSSQRSPYNTISLSGVLANQASGYGFYVENLPSNGIQNGAPDGIALIGPGGAVLEFISYEGSFTAASGPAAGMTSTNIGVSENGGTAVGQSLQLTGSGRQGSDFSWSGPAAQTPGSLNSGQTIAAIPGVSVTLTVYDASGNSSSCTGTVTVLDSLPPVAVCNNPTIYLDGSGNATITPGDIDGGSTDNCGVDSLAIDRSVFSCPATNPGTAPALPWINEFHYDNVSGDVGEFIEVAGTAGTDLSNNYSLVLYNGSNGTFYNTISLSGIVPNEAGGAGAVSFSLPTNGLQNGGPDGIALVQGSTVLEFLSYEGTFTASNGPANGMTSTDVGVSEGGGTPVGSSLQRTGAGSVGADFTWTGPLAESPGSLNAGQTVTPNAGTNDVILTVWDVNGNSSTCTANVTVVDSTAPAAVCKNDTIYLDGNGLATLSPSDVDGGSNDNCGIDSMAVDSTSFDCSQRGPHTVTLTVWDPSGNSASCTATVTVIDSTAPTINFCPAPIKVCEDDTVFYNTPTFDDNCAGTGLAGNLQSGLPSGSVFPVGVNYAIWDYTDPSGNVSPACSVQVTVAPKPRAGDTTIYRCDGDIVLLDLQAHVDSNGNGVNSNFVWSAAPVAGVLGISTSPQSGDIITDSLVNTTTQVRTIVYTVTPTSDPDACVGPDFRVTVVLRPSSRSEALPADICPGSLVNIASLVRDYSFLAYSYAFYDAHPDSGGVLIGGGRAYRGGVYPPHRTMVAPRVTTVYWAVATTGFGCERVFPIPVAVDTACAGTVAPIALLEGAYDATTGLQRTRLQQQSLVPVTEPYTAMGYTFYGGGGETMNVPQNLQSQIVDWVVIELRDGYDSTHLVYSRAALLMSDGRIVDTDGSSNPAVVAHASGRYYVTILHRNHLAVMTAQPVLISNTIDFTDPQLPVFGGNTSTRVIVNGEALMYSGDADGNGQVQNVDDVMHWMPSAGTSGYKGADYNLDGQVQNTDRVLIWHRNVGRGTAVPE